MLMLVAFAPAARAQDGRAESHITRVAFPSIPGVRRRMQVYTPAGYAERGPRRFPTLDLLGGGGEDETG
jgi:hypothetical protein